MHVFHQNRQILSSYQGTLTRNPKFLTENQHGSRKSRVLICNINTPLFATILANINIIYTVVINIGYTGIGGRQLKITMQTIVNCWHTWGSMWNFRKVWRFQFVLENEDLFLRVLKNEEVKKSIFLHNEDEDKTIATFVEEEDFHLEKCSRLKIWRALLMMWTKWILRCVQGPSYMTNKNPPHLARKSQFWGTPHVPFSRISCFFEHHSSFDT